ncbi:peptidase 1 [Auriculariales sp. MPI-PUGE-AT-0066]|nr:peptidase 1 [Auriculariales sp. MPI-PUGE-AT-0066]
MQFLLANVLAALVLIASGAPNKLLTVQKYAGTKVVGSYIVHLKADADKDALFAADPVLAESVTHPDWTIINAFAGRFSTETLNKLRASDLVDSILEDGVVSINDKLEHISDDGGSVSIEATQTDAPWGLHRLSSTSAVNGDQTLLNYTYTYSDSYQGQGVDVYIVDTGINLAHVDFGGRAKNGYVGTGLNSTDDNGHGSNVASVAGGTRWGVAKQVSLISVKVLDSSGSGTLANVVGGFNYVGTAAAASGRPSLASASLGGSASTSIDSAVTALTSAGIPVVVAAGNSNVDAGTTSPARVTSAFTVGAIDITDTKASFSNYGSVVDIWAPGVYIPGAYYTSTTALAAYSGTSQATPHISGLVAIYLSEFGKTAPNTIIANLWSRTGILKSIPSGTVNRLGVGPVTV